MRQRIDERSKLQGLNESRLPYFTEEEKVELKGKSILNVFGIKIINLILISNR